MKPTGITGRNHQMKSIYNTLRATGVRSWMSKQGVDFQGIQGRQVSQNKGLCRKSTLQGEQMQRWELYLHGDSELAGKRLGREVDPITEQPSHLLKHISVPGFSRTSQLRAAMDLSFGFCG